jgi:simple sugar transport system permease protein
VRWLFLLSLTLGGVIAGLAGALEVSGVHHRLIEGLQSNYLLLGIIIGLIAKGNHLAVPFVAFFIAMLEVGANAMQRTLAIPGEMVFIVEALILIFVLLSDVVHYNQSGVFNRTYAILSLDTAKSHLFDQRIAQVLFKSSCV